jgi:glycogen debranching enzyme
MMEEVIKVQDQYYIVASAARADERSRVLKQGDTFAVFDRFGDVVPIGLGEEGLYHESTRFLSRMQLRLGAVRPLLLSSTVKETNDLLRVDLTNPDISLEGHLVIPRGTVHIFRVKLLWNGVCYEQLRISNHGLGRIRIAVSFRFDADFADIFEVRGARREQRGERLPDAVEDGSVLLSYRGLDDVVRGARLQFTPPPQELSGQAARFELSLDPQSSESIFLSVSCESDFAPPRVLVFEDAAAAAAAAVPGPREGRCSVFTSNEQFNDWLKRSAADLTMMVTETAHGPYPYAGVPWFSTVFGRDGIITALSVLWAEPRIARGVLSYLAATQADASDPVRDAEPGKVLHETRKGEMAALGEVPFGLYYGSVDATPLFVILAGAYYARTADAAFAQGLWPHVERALRWIDRHGDLDGDGFVEYARLSPKGLVQQGWKDSFDSVVHADGSLAEAPIALCEVQAYVYAARRSAARLATVLGREERAAELEQQAETLRQLFEERFWSDELSTYVLALDGRKQPCRVRASNAGHCLFGGIASEERAARTADTLLAADSFSGWGIRTLAASERRYNPMSYHNGSVWPHDTALTALGFARYGLNDRARELLTGLFDASLFVDLHRMPELFCGFKKRVGEGPTLYPVACAPQSWAAASVFLCLQACLGMEVDASRGQLLFRRPTLPESLKWVRIEGLTVGEASIDLRLDHHPHNVSVDVLRRRGDVEILTVS